MKKNKKFDEILENNEDIIKDYQLKLLINMKKKMKIKYNNPDDVDKVLAITSTDDDILEVRTKELKVEYKDMNFIRLTFNSPSTKCIYKPCVIIKNKANDQIEEILRFRIEINDF